MKNKALPFIDNKNDLVDEFNLQFQRRLIEKELIKNKLDLKRTKLSDKERKTIFDKTNGLCHICSCLLDINSFEADHINPFAKSGDDSTSNFLPSCSQCNNYRWEYSPEEIQWIIKLGVWLKTKFQENHTNIESTLANFITDEINREKRRKTKREPKEIVINYNDLLPIKGSLKHGTKSTSLDEIETCKNIIQQYLVDITDSNSINGKSFLISGQSSYSRDILKTKINDKGGIIKQSISSKLDYLVIGHFYGYNKLIKLNELNKKNNIKIVLLNQLEKQLIK